jgi:hypothetical protein
MMTTTRTAAGGRRFARHYDLWLALACERRDTFLSNRRHRSSAQRRPLRSAGRLTTEPAAAVKIPVGIEHLDLILMKA